LEVDDARAQISKLVAARSSKTVSEREVFVYTILAARKFTTKEIWLGLPQEFQAALKQWIEKQPAGETVAFAFSNGLSVDIKDDLGEFQKLFRRLNLEAK
jgi:hypothetical protein